MPQQINLVEHLISLRNHYQGLLSESEQTASHALEQLTHINALLVDHVEHQQLVHNLIELRSRYLRQHEEHKRAATHAREQLNHIQALLADELLLEHHRQPFSLETASLARLEDLQLSAAAESEASLPSLDQAKEPDKPASEPQVSVTATEMTGDQSELEIAADDEDAALHHLQFSALKTPMKPRYQHLTKTQAVEQILREHQGTILHIGWIIRELYGELSEEEIKDEKPRMYDTLSRGVEKGMWDKVPDQASCYTLDLKLVEPETVSERKAQSNRSSSRPRRLLRRGHSSEEMMPRYQQLNFTEAVATVVNENPGQILTTELVAHKLYGDLSGQALTKAKDKIGKTLWSGAKQDRWQRVPGQLGRYTLALRLIGL